MFTHKSQSLLRPIFVILSLVVCSVCVSAERDESDVIPFESLSEQQQQVLEPLRNRWQSLPPERQKRLLKGAERWQNMSDEERAKVRDRMQRWKQLSPEQRQSMR
ncbi:MAG: DUF3106 domain-containing protein, partial [Pseudomonadota bacterium]